MTRITRIALLGLVLAAVSGPSLASIPTEMPLSGRVEASTARGYATAASALAYAAPGGTVATGLVRPAEATAREEEAPAPRKTCPARSWPNLAPRCVADLTGGQS